MNRFEKRKRCAFCDAELAKLTPLEMFMLGSGLGERGGLEETILRCCTKHQPECLAALAEIQRKVDAVHAAADAEA